MNFSSTLLPEINRQSLARRPVFSFVRLLVRPWAYRVAAAAGECCCGTHISCPILCWLCHLLYTHTLMVLHQMSQHSQHQSIARIILVPSGPFCLRTEQGKLLQHFFLLFLFPILGTGWERLEYTEYSVFDDQSISSNYLGGHHAIQYHSIPQKKVSSRLEGERRHALRRKYVGCLSNFDPSTPLYTQDTSFSVKSSLTAVRQGAKVPSSDIFAHAPYERADTFGQPLYF